MAQTSRPVIRTRDLTKDLPLGKTVVHALRGVNLEIQPGEMVGIIGPSGSGKSTLLGLIGGLDKPTRGSIEIDGVDISKLGEDKLTEIRNEKIGFIFQFFALVPVLSAYENVELPLLLNGTGAKERRQRVMQMLEAVGLVDRAHHRPDQLSGGQQQRVAIARALAPKPLMVLADEPTANLDTTNGQQAMEIMQRLNQETGAAFIFATHDPRVMSYARRTVTMRDGHIVSNGQALG